MREDEYPATIEAFIRTQSFLDMNPPQSLSNYYMSVPTICDMLQHYLHFHVDKGAIQ